MGIYCRGTTFDAVHMENFIKSKTHKRFMKKTENGSPTDMAATIGALVDVGGVHQINFLKKGSAQTPKCRTMTRAKNFANSRNESSGFMTFDHNMNGIKESGN